MSKFSVSHEAIDSSLLLWDVKNTQTGVEETYELRIHPNTTIDNENGSPITFIIPPQIKGELIDVEVVTSWNVKDGNTNLTQNQQVSIINNISNALWSNVQVELDDRINVMQSMEQAYNLQCFFETVLNAESNRKDMLFIKELWKMDEGDSKGASENPIFFATNEAAVTNSGAHERAERIKLSRVVTICSALNCPLFKHSKALPTNMKIRVTLTKNRDQYILMAADNSNFKLNILDIYLKCTYMRPRDFIIKMQEERLVRNPALYDIDSGEIIMRTVNIGSQNIVFNDIFQGKPPKAAFFCIQNPLDITGYYHRNPNTFIPYKSLQLYMNNKQYFPRPLTMNPNNECGDMLDQLYKSIGKQYQGDCLINSKNFVLNFIVGVVLTADRTHTKHFNISEPAETRVEIDLGFIPTEPLVLIIYTVNDKIITVDANRRVSILE